MEFEVLEVVETGGTSAELAQCDGSGGGSDGCSGGGGCGCNSCRNVLPETTPVPA